MKAENTESFKRGLHLRKQLVNERGEVLCVDFAGTLQAADIQKRTDLIPDALNGKYCYRAKINVKDFDNLERAKKGLPPFNFNDEKAIYEALKEEFDIPLWILRTTGDDIKNIRKYNLPLIYQIKGCNFHSGRKGGGCKFCFVDDDSNSGEISNGVYLSPDNIVATLETVKESKNIYHVRISGGEPTIVLDHILALLKLLNLTSPGTITQFDSNLSTGHLIEYFIQQSIFEDHILEKMAEYDPKVLVCFKGTDNEDVIHNIKSGCPIEEQIYSLKKMVAAELDVYPHIINPNPLKLKEFLERLEDEIENILLKLHIFRINLYEPNKERIRLMANEAGISYETGLKYFETEWTLRHQCAEDIMNNLLYKKFGVNYKEVERPGIRLRVKI